MSSSEVIPLEPILQNIEEKRLWLGNLDPRLTEYQLIKILQRFGNIEKFDLLFHRSGPMEGQPRGYAFVTYKESAQAVTAMEKLHGKKLGSKQISVKWAHTLNTEEPEKVKVTPDIPALAGAKKSSLSNPSSTIQAIEAKLRLMQRAPSPEPDFTGRPTLAVQPRTWKPRPTPVSSRVPPRSIRDRYRDKKRSQPYTKSKWR